MSTSRLRQTLQVLLASLVNQDDSASDLRFEHMCLDEVMNRHCRAGNNR